MSAIAILAAQLLLLAAVLGTRPATGNGTRSLLLLQAGLLWACLLLHGLVWPVSPLPFVCVLAVSIEMLLLFVRGGTRADAPAEANAAAAPWPMLAGVLAAWLAFRLLPSPQSPLADAALGIVLCGVVGLLSARGKRPGSERARLAALLTAGHGVLLFTGTVPGPGWPGLLMALLPQGLVLQQFCARPAWTDEIGAGVE